MCQNSVTKHNTQCSWNTYAYISIFLWYQTCSFLEGLESAGAVCFVFSPSQPTALHSGMKRHSANVLDKITLHVFEKISRPVSILTNNTVKGQIVSFLLLIYFYSNTSTYKSEKKNHRYWMINQPDFEEYWLAPAALLLQASLSPIAAGIKCKNYPHRKTVSLHGKNKIFKSGMQQSTSDLPG